MSDDKTASYEELEVHATSQEEEPSEPKFSLANQNPSLECFVGFSQSITTRQSRGMFSVIDDLVDDIHLLLEVAQLPRVPIDLSYKTLKERFDTGEADETIYNQHTLQLQDAAYYREEEYRKVQRECSWLADVFDSITEQNDLGQMVLIFERILSTDTQTNRDEEDLNRQVKTNRERVAYYKNSILSERRDMSALIRECSQMIGTLKDEMEDLIAENTVKMRYVDEWENNRLDTNSMIFLDKEENYKQTTAFYKKEIDKEVRIHEEIEKFIKVDQEYMKEQIEVWMEKYDETLDEKDTQIDALKLTRDEQSMKLKELREEYERRQKAIDEYLAHKEVLRLEALELKRKNIAATTIQSWWRGTMFRKGLGPYRKKKPRKKSGKNKGKGKKK